MTLELTETEADFVHQALSLELRMLVLAMDDPTLTAVQQRNVGFKIENYQQIMQKLVAS
jgi:hypothetical protein